MKPKFYTETPVRVESLSPIYSSFTYRGKTQKQFAIRVNFSTVMHYENESKRKGKDEKVELPYILDFDLGMPRTAEQIAADKARAEAAAARVVKQPLGVVKEYPKSGGTSSSSSGATIAKGSASSS